MPYDSDNPKPVWLQFFLPRGIFFQGKGGLWLSPLLLLIPSKGVDIERGMGYTSDRQVLVY